MQSLGAPILRNEVGIAGCRVPMSIDRVTAVFYKAVWCGQNAISDHLDAIRHAQILRLQFKDNEVGASRQWWQCPSGCTWDNTTPENISQRIQRIVGNENIKFLLTASDLHSTGSFVGIMRGDVPCEGILCYYILFSCLLRLPILRYY